MEPKPPDVIWFNPKFNVLYKSPTPGAVAYSLKSEHQLLETDYLMARAKNRKLTELLINLLNGKDESAHAQALEYLELTGDLPPTIRLPVRN